MDEPFCLIGDIVFCCLEGKGIASQPSALIWLTVDKRNFAPLRRCYVLTR